MREGETINAGVKTVQKTGRLAYLLEFLVIVALTALAAYGAS